MPNKPKWKTRVLHWPSLGVVRRHSYESAPGHRDAYPTHWAINTRVQDPIQKRLRGGSRLGLTKFIANDLEITVDSMIAVPAKSGTSVADYLVVVADGYLGVISGGTLDTTADYLEMEDGTLILTDETEAGNPIELSTSDIPADCFLIPRSGKAYAVTTSAIYEINPVRVSTRTLTASSGTIPLNCTHGCFYRDRLVLAGQNNVIYFSRQGDAEDWNYGGNVGDTGRAKRIQLSESSEIGDTVTALMPLRDDSMIAATQYGLWLLNGDPATGGMRNISRGIGVIRSTAWCSIKDARVGDAPTRNAFVFLSELGLFMVGPTGDGLESLSEDRVPLELKNIAASTDVSLVYSPEERGVYIFVTPATGTATHWFFDMVNKGFWPVAFQEDHQPLDVCNSDGNVVLACKDGYIRYIGGDDDDGTDIESYVLLGPIRLSDPNTYGITTTIQGILGESGGDVTWNLITGDTAEEACSNGVTAIEAYQDGDATTADEYVMASGTWEAGRSKFMYPRVRSMWMCVLLKSSAKWAYESIIMESREAGRWR